MDITRLLRLAQRQGGLFTRQQARACGLSAYQVRHRIQVGEWTPVIGPVLASSMLNITNELREQAVQLAVPGSVLAGPSAARLWRMPVPDGPPCLLVGPHSRPRLEGVRWIFGNLDPRDVWLADGVVPVTSRARTVFDCLRILPDRANLGLLDRALQQGWITAEDLSDRVRRHLGRRGAPRLVRLVGAVSTGTRSAAERVMASLLADAGIGGWRANGEVTDAQGVIGTADIVLDEAKLIVELDGWAFHTTPDRFQHDRERQNRLITAGWTVLRFTWYDLTRRPTYVIATIRAALRAAGRNDRGVPADRAA